MSKAKPQPPELGLREQKKRQTLFDLCMAARRLTVERGLDGTTAEDIAKAVGVSPRTFFNYYETKLDAVVGPIGEIGTPQAREKFVAGGPTGVLIDDLTALYASGYEPEDEVLESISLVSRIINTETRVLAAFIAAGAGHEDALRELVVEREGDEISPDFAALAAALMSTLTMRAAMSLGQQPTRSLIAALNDQKNLAAKLFQPTEDRKRRRTR